MVLDPRYLSSPNLAKASQVYGSQSPRSIRLEHIFDQKVFELLKAKVSSAKFKEEFHPEKHLYETAKVKEVESFLKGPYFKVLARHILGIDKFKISFEVRRFTQGSYTLLHDTEQERPGVDFILDFSDASSFGGYTTYLTQDKELLTLVPKSNSLTFIERRDGVMRFTKYVQKSQREPILQVVGTFHNIY